MSRLRFSISGLKIAALVYIALPTLIFLGCMLRPLVAIPAFALTVWALVLAMRHFSRTAVQEVGEKQLSLPWWLFLVLTAVVLGLCVLSGQFGVCLQMWDWFSRNATFRDLITHAWPVVYPKAGGMAMSFYCGHWLPPALVGRGVLLATGSLDVAWRIGNICLGLWTVLGVEITVLLILTRVKARSVLAILVALLVFVTFEGTGFIGKWVLIWKNNAQFRGPWSVLFQFTSNSALLSWVFHQTVVPWLATALFLDGRRMFPCSVFILALIPLCGPFPAVGLGWMLAVMALTAAARTRVRAAWRDLVKSLATFPNLVGVLVVVPLVAALLFTNSATGQVGPAWSDVQPRSYFFHRWMLFVVCEIGVYSAVLLTRFWRNPMYWAAFSFLALCPLLQIGPSCDFCMRASIPALFAVMAMVIEYVLDGSWRRWWAKVLLAACLLYCGFEVGSEMCKIVIRTNALKAQGMTVVCDPLYTYDRNLDEFPIHEESDRLIVQFSNHFYCSRPEETFFFRYLAKSPKK